MNVVHDGCFVVCDEVVPGGKWFILLFAGVWLKFDLFVGVSLHFEVCIDGINLVMEVVHQGFVEVWWHVILCCYRSFFLTNSLCCIRPS